MMANDVLVERLDVSDMKDLSDQLRADSLPTDDLIGPGRCFWRLSDAKGPIGYGGIEGEQPDALLRSIAVLPQRRGSGAGRVIVDKMKMQTQKSGIRRLWLLTLDKANFFMRCGFRIENRKDAPATVQATSQFKGLCPDDAVCMALDLDPANG